MAAPSDAHAALEMTEYFTSTALEMYRTRQAVEEYRRRRPSTAPPIDTATACAARASRQKRQARARQVADPAKAKLANDRWCWHSRREGLQREGARLDRDLAQRQRKIEHERAIGQEPTRAQSRQYRRAAERRREQEELLTEVYIRTAPMKPRVCSGRAGRLLLRQQQQALLGGGGSGIGGGGAKAADHVLQEAFRDVHDRRNDAARMLAPILDRHIVEGRRTVARDPLQVEIALERRRLRTRVAEQKCALESQQATEVSHRAAPLFVNVQ